MNLWDLQHHFLDGLHRSQSDLLLDELEKGFSQPERFRIYQNNVQISLIKALANIYSVCQRLVGEAFFHAMAGQFVRRTVSRSFSLNDYGAGFSSFIANFPPAASLPYLSEVAELEWAVHQAQIGPDNATLDAKALSRLEAFEQENLVFTLAENGTLLSSEFPIDKIWEMNQEAEVTEMLDLSETTERIVLYVWRLDWDLCLKRLNALEAQFIRSVARGQCLKSIVQELSLIGHEQALAELLPNFIRIGCITGFQHA